MLSSGLGKIAPVLSPFRPMDTPAPHMAICRFYIHGTAQIRRGKALRKIGSHGRAEIFALPLLLLAHWTRV
jgi:hypothetical protein